MTLHCLNLKQVPFHAQALVTVAAGTEPRPAPAVDGPRLREAVLQLLAAAPPGAERELVTAVSLHLTLAPCSVALCRLLLATLHLPAVCRVRLSDGLHWYTLEKHAPVASLVQTQYRKVGEGPAWQRVYLRIPVLTPPSTRGLVCKL